MSKKFVRICSLAVASVLVLMLGPVAAQQPPSPGCPPDDLTNRCTVTVDLYTGRLAANQFTPNSPVRFEVFESQGGQRIFGPVTYQTDSNGGWHATHFATAAGNFVAVTDVATSTVKTVQIGPLSIDAIDFVNDIVSGTAGSGDLVTVGLVGLGGGKSVFTEADTGGSWTADFAALSADVTEHTAVSVSVRDVDGDVTTNGPPPGCPPVHPGQSCRLDVSYSDDGMNALGFTPSSSVRFRVYESVGGPLIYGPLTMQTDGTGFSQAQSDVVIDIVPGNYVTVTETSSSTVKALEVSPLTIDAKDAAADTVSGTARPGDTVWVGLQGSPNGAVAVADEAGLWTASFTGGPDPGQDVTEQSGPVASVFDPDFDSTSTDPGLRGQDFVIGVGLEHDSLLALGFTPNSDVVFEFYESPGGQKLLHVTETTNGMGNRFVNFGINPGPDVVPGNYLVVTDVATEKVNTLEVADMSIDRVDPATDVVEGHSAPGAQVNVTAGTTPSGLVLEADAVGNWTADFSGSGYDITSEDWFRASVMDADGDITGHQLGSPIPGCQSDVDTTCGSAGPDTIREDDGEVIAGGEDDTTLIGADEGTDEIDLDLGTGDDGVVIDPSKRHRFLTSLMSSVASLLPVTVDGGGGSDVVILPTHVAELVVRVMGGDGKDIVKLRSLGGGNLPTRGRYTLIGGEGNDKLTGADGDDILEGGGGTDELRGGKGFDTCYATGADQTFSCERVINKRHR
jgi:Ca2+-binding RTX toxin-like protein